MIFFPNHKITKRIIQSPYIILPPICCYLFFFLPNAKEAISIFINASPESLAAAMAKPWGAGLFWAYAGAFDLFVGRWIFLDAKQRNILFFPIAIILLISIAFGPIGFLLYSIVRYSYTFFRERKSKS